MDPRWIWPTPRRVQGPKDIPEDYRRRYWEAQVIPGWGARMDAFADLMREEPTWYSRMAHYKHSRRWA